MLTTKDSILVSLNNMLHCNKGYILLHNYNGIEFVFGKYSANNSHICLIYIITKDSSDVDYELMLEIHTVSDIDFKNIADNKSIKEKCFEDIIKESIDSKVVRYITIFSETVRNQELFDSVVTKYIG